MSLSRSFALARRVATVQRSLRLDMSPAMVRQDWRAALLNLDSVNHPTAEASSFVDAWPARAQRSSPQPRSTPANMHSLSRSFALARRVSTVQRSLRLDTPAARPPNPPSNPRPHQDWSSLLNDLDASVTPMVVTAAASPFHIIAVNDAWSAMCGYTHSEALGNTLAMIQGPSTSRDALKKVRKYCSRSQLAHTPLELELINYTKDRKRSFLNEVRVSPVDVSIEGEPSGSVFVGAMKHLRWLDELKAEPATAAERSAAAEASPHFTLEAALARSGGKPALAVRNLGKPQYNLNRLNGGTGF
ncbi:hypothetical protein T492DRAFT_930200 [Pavlovales sp. CCMP2436]|nr:hypothetical protein T492DRAFT_930200 [Pavlovales sp. CCMP2436]|mmetsp:Transcript_39822/g.98504  ORF Transcript_39822/g.98504 Transcript_39822/m.98504 type:complete len:302 (-) Transcript_39822:163-1068(-)